MKPKDKRLVPNLTGLKSWGFRPVIISFYVDRNFISNFPILGNIDTCYNNQSLYLLRGNCLIEKDSVKDARKALVVLAVEKALLDVGKPTYDEVLGKLYQDYHCYISDCYENPEYLSRVLKELYGQSYLAIIESIKKQLDDTSTHEGILNFLMKISK